MHTHAHTYSQLYCVCAVLLLFTSDQAFIMIQSWRGFFKIHGHNIFTEKQYAWRMTGVMSLWGEKMCCKLIYDPSFSQSFFFQWMCNIHLWKYTPVGFVIYTCEIMHLCNIHLLVRIWWGAESLFRTVVALRDFYGLVSSTFFHEKALW